MKEIKETNGGIVVLHCVFAFAVMMFAIVLQGIGAALIPKNILFLSIITILCIVIMVLLLRLYLLKVVKITLKDIGFTTSNIIKDLKWIWIGIILVIAVLFLNNTLGLVKININRELPVITIAAYSLVSAFFNGSVEELAFRGVMMNVLRKKWNIIIAIVMPSIFFGIIHILNFITNIKLIDLPLLIIGGLLVGTMFSVVAYFTKSLWSSIFLHFTWNSLAVYGILHYSQKPLTDTIINPVFISSNVFFTGAEHGVEVAIPALLCYLSVSILVILIYRKKVNKNQKKNDLLQA